MTCIHPTRTRLSEIVGIFDNYRGLIKLALLLLAQIVGIFDNYRGLIKLALLLLAQIVGIFDNYRALLKQRATVIIPGCCDFRQ
ncbi:MAG: hypothetical protein F6K26_43485 [Moorea sp. SIO2I5]|nr:hypothetical protein [Moorena sp. SIO2I5]